jgi:hypothetical protein
VSDVTQVLPERVEEDDDPRISSTSSARDSSAVARPIPYRVPQHPAEHLEAERSAPVEAARDREQAPGGKR